MAHQYFEEDESDINLKTLRLNLRCMSYISYILYIALHLYDLDEQRPIKRKRVTSKSEIGAVLRFIAGTRFRWTHHAPNDAKRG